MNNFFQLIINLTIKSPDGKDVHVSTSRTIPFQPVEGLTLLLPLCEGEDENYDDEYPIELGPPTYSYLESSFVESQEDDTVYDMVRDGDATLSEAMDAVVKGYEAYGFKKVRK